MSEHRETTPGPDTTTSTAPRRVMVFSDAAVERNGVGSYYADLVYHLSRAGQPTELICSGLPEGRWDGKLRFPLPGDSTQRVVLPPVQRILRHAAQNRPLAIVVATPGPYGLLGLTIARRLGVRLLVGFHTSFQRMTGLYWNRLLNTLTRWYFGTCDSLLFRKAEVVIANSDDMAEHAKELGAGNVRVIGTPLPADFLAESLPLRSDKPLHVLFAGRLAAEKNVMTVIEAAASCPEMQFRIAGDGPLADEVTARAKELPNLDYLGWLNRSQLCQQLDRADLFVLPSHVEAFGTAALEGMARGRNVLVSARCGITEWPSLERGLFQMLDGENLVSALQRIENLDPTVRQERAQIAREAALALHYSALESWHELLRAPENG